MSRNDAMQDTWDAWDGLALLGRSTGSTITRVMDAHDEMLCRAVLHAVANGADEAEWIQMMRDTRALLSSRFFDHVRHFEAQANADAG
jgi:hypothetical protein